MSERSPSNQPPVTSHQPPGTSNQQPRFTSMRASGAAQDVNLSHISVRAGMRNASNRCDGSRAAAPSVAGAVPPLRRGRCRPPREHYHREVGLPRLVLQRMQFRLADLREGAGARRSTTRRSRAAAERTRRSASESVMSRSTDPRQPARSSACIAAQNEASVNSTNAALSRTIAWPEPRPIVAYLRTSICHVIGFASATTRNALGSGSSG
jgi:hypothetical protein